MSVRHLALAAEILGLTPASKSLMIALAYAADDKGHVRCTNQRLAELTCLSERAIRANLRKLEQLRYIHPTGAARYAIASWNMPVTL